LLRKDISFLKGLIQAIKAWPLVTRKAEQRRKLFKLTDQQVLTQFKDEQ
jgi:hypothetical protein